MKYDDRRAFIASMSGLAATLMLPANSLAQPSAYPNRPVKIIVPFPPGGVADPLGRLIAQQLTERMGQQFIVENRDGASSNIGSDYVARSAPDGYTLLLGASNVTVNMSLYKGMLLDAARDLDAICLVANATIILTTNQSVPVNSVKDLIALAREKPNFITVGFSGGGSPAQLAAVQFASITQTKMISVPYRGAGPASVDFLAGRIMVMFSNIPAVLQHIKSGKIKALALADEQRSPALPNLPTMAEAGITGYEQTGWYGLMAPAGTPGPLIQQLNKEVNEILATPAIRERLLQNGAYPQGGTPDRFAQLVRNDIRRYAEMVKQGKLTIEM